MARLAPGPGVISNLETTPQLVHGQTESRAALLIAAASGMLRLWLSVALPFTEMTENMRVGISLASSGSFSDPFFVPTGATAHVAPLYPFLIAGSIKLAGSATAGLIVARCILTLGLCAFIACLPRIAVALGFGARAGLLVALAFAFPSPPVFVWLEISGEHETVLTAVLLATLTTLTVSAVRHERLSFQRAALLGAGWSIGMHASPTLLLPMLAAWSAPAVFSRRYRSMVLRAAPAWCLTFLMGVAPWIARNHLVMGAPAFVRDNFGLELAMSNSDDAAPDMYDNVYNGRTMIRHPYFNRASAAELRAVGEMEYYRRKGQEATRWIVDHPDRFMSLTLARLRLFFLPKLERPVHAYFYLPVLLLWIAGSVHFWRSSPLTTFTLNSVLLAYALPHFLVQSTPRYSYPVLWIMLLFASHMSLVIIRAIASSVWLRNLRS